MFTIDSSMPLSWESAMFYGNRGLVCGKIRGMNDGEIMGKGETIMKKIYISADIEGIWGNSNPVYTSKSGSQYE